MIIFHSILRCVGIGAFVIALPTVNASPESDAWFKERREKIQRVKSNPNERNINDLAETLSGLGIHLKNASDEYLTLYRDVQKTLCDIPGLPESFRDRILKARTEMEAQPDQYLRADIFNRTMQHATSGFGTMRHMPTPAVVRVLGEFLTDDRGGYVPDPDKPEPRSDHLMALLQVRTSNSQYAASVLNDLPIEDKPLVKTYNPVQRPTPEDLSIWRQWYQRIKSGNATFRFEGDPNEYDLDGPAPPEKLKRIAQARQRDTAREQRHQAEGTSGTQPNRTEAPATSGPGSRGSNRLLLTGILAAAGAAVVTITLHFARRRRPFRQA